MLYKNLYSYCPCDSKRVCKLYFLLDHHATIKCASNSNCNYLVLFLRNAVGLIVFSPVLKPLDSVLVLFPCCFMTSE